MIKHLRHHWVAYMLSSILILSGFSFYKSYDFSTPRNATYAMTINDMDMVTCSAVAISPKLMLTAAHCVTPANPDNVYWVQDTRKRATGDLSPKVRVYPIKVNAEADVALLERLEGVFDDYIPVADKSPPADWRIVVVGYPMGSGKHITTGQWVGIAEKTHPNANEKVVTFGKINAPIIYGNSGGGVFRWTGFKWELVGIVSQLRVEPLGFTGILFVFHMGYVVPPENFFLYN